MRAKILLTLAAVMSLSMGAVTACGADNGAVQTAKAHDGAKVLADDIAASSSLVKSADSVVVASAGEETQRRAAAIAVAAKVPMLVVSGGADVQSEGSAKSPKKDDRALDSGAPMEEVIKELDRLQAKTVLSVGAVDLGNTEQRTVIKDPGTNEGLEQIVGVPFGPLEKKESRPSRIIAEMDPEKPTVPDAIDRQPSESDFEAANKGSDDAEKKATELPRGEVKERKDLIALAAPGTSLASIATARAAGLKIDYLPAPDVRATKESIEIAQGDKPVVALGLVFGTQKKFDESLKLAQNKDVPQLPGGGTLLFPGRHIVATYGHPGIAPLGVMGEDDPEGAVKRAKDYVKQYEKLADDKVIPAFEIIASVAQASPGPRGDYSEPAPVEVLKPYVEEMTKAGGYVIIDLQPGSADFLEQAKIYEELLKLPNVGLALDAEWKMLPGQVPATEVGHVEIEEVNRVAKWLADLIRENNLPQKMLMLHQFQLQMIRDREKLDLTHPELAVVLHADGHGTAEQKFETWNVLLQDLQPEVFEAWKNFIDEDQPMFTPEETMNIEPRPWVVTYQ